MSLTRLSDQVWETLNLYLREHNRVRLVLTGDAKLQRDVISSRRSLHCRLTAYPWQRVLASDLVCGAMLSGATRVVTDESYLVRWAELRGPGPHPLLPRLTTLSSFADNPRANAAVLDLRDFCNLQTLKFPLTSPQSTYVLPASLTKLSNDYGNLNKFTNFGELTNVVTLHVALYAEELARFEHEAVWPPQLTSLKLGLLFRDEHSADETREMESVMARVLPRTLLRLSVTDTRASAQTEPRACAVDIASVARCTSLERLEFAASCGMRHPGTAFPPTLTSLKIDQLCLHSPNDPVFDALASSAIACLTVWSVDGPASHRWHGALAPIFDRANLEEVEQLAYAIDRCRLAAPGSPLLDFCVHALARFGLDAAHLDLVLALQASSPMSNVPELARKCRPEHVRRLLSDESIVQFVRVRGPFAAEDFEWALQYGLAWRATWRDVLGVQTGAVDVNGLTLRRALTRVVQLDVTEDVDVTLSQWERIIGDYCYPDVKVVKLTAEGREPYLEIMRRHAANFPSLEACFLVGHHPATPRDVCLLAEMRMYPLDTQNNTFRWRACPPAKAVHTGATK